MDVADFQRLRVDIGEVPAAVHDEDRMVGTGCVDVRALQVPHLGDHAVVITVPDDPFARLLGLGVLADHILKLGDDLKAEIGKIQQDMPVGLEIHQVSDQPSVVAESIHDFVKTLVEAIVIVLAVVLLRGDQLVELVETIKKVPSFAYRGGVHPVGQVLRAKLLVLVRLEPSTST